MIRPNEISQLQLRLPNANHGSKSPKYVAHCLMIPTFKRCGHGYERLLGWSLRFVVAFLPSKSVYICCIVRRKQTAIHNDTYNIVYIYISLSLMHTQWINTNGRSYGHFTIGWEAWAVLKTCLLCLVHIWFPCVRCDQPPTWRASCWFFQICWLCVCAHGRFNHQSGYCCLPTKFWLVLLRDGAGINPSYFTVTQWEATAWWVRSRELVKKKKDSMRRTSVLKS